MKIAVIGSGPSGLATILGLLEKSQATDEIFVVHGNQRWSSLSYVNGARKHKFGSNYMFSKQSQFLASNNTTNLSLANGGLSAIWGAGLRLWDEGDISNLGVDPKRVYQSARRLLELIPYTGGNAEINLPQEWEIKANENIHSAKSFEKLHKDQIKDSKCEVVRPSLAIHTIGQKSCQNCGLCLSGCPYGSIFDSGDAIDSLILKGRIQSISGVVNSILPKSTGIQLTIDKETNLRFEEFDEVHLSAGAIGTPLLLLNSNLLSKHLHVKDSQIFNLIGLRRPQKISTEVFPLGQAIIKSKTQCSTPFSVTLFQLNKDLISNITLGFHPILRFPLKRLGYLSKFVFVGIGFLDSNDSDELKIDNEHKSITFNRTHGKIAQFLKVFQIMIRCNRIILLKGFFLIPLFQTISKPGHGYHSGAALPLGGELVDDLGRLRLDPRIYISDTSLLRFIKPGAHTFMTMSLIHSLRGN